MKTIAVLGGGLAGLTAASDLVAQGHRVVVFERDQGPGGFIRTEETDGWLIESGPNTFQSSGGALSRKIKALGLESELLLASEAAKKRYVVRGGFLRALPTSPSALLTSGLFSLGAKVRILRELFQRPHPSGGERTVAQAMREHFGNEVLAYAVQPFVSGIFAGDPEALSFEHAFPTLAKLEESHGSLLRGQMARAKERRRSSEPAVPPLASFRHGLGTLVDALVRRLPEGSLRLGSSVAELIPGEGWTVRLDSHDAPESERFDAVLSTLPAQALARLVIAGKTPLSDMGRVQTPPIASLFLGYRKEQVGHALDGFGVLVPHCEKQALLGCLFSSTLFPYRAPSGCVAVTAMAGGALNPELACMEAEALGERLLPELEKLLKIQGQPIFLRHNAWPRSIPQYAPGYDHLLGTLARCEADHPGLVFGGMVRDGISLPAAVEAGESLAGRCLA